MKKIVSATVMAIVFLLCFSGCQNKDEQPQQASTEQIELNGEYAYLRVRVLSKDIEAKTMQVRVVDFGSFAGVNIGSVPVGTEGELDCSELMMMGGIKEGEWVISYLDQGQTRFPLRIYSIESTENFSERVQN